MEGSEKQVRSRFKEVLSAVAGTHEEQIRAIARTILREPFTKRAWSELAFFSFGTVLGIFGIAFVVITLSAGVVLAITFFGLGLMALSVRGARGFGGFHRQLARSYLGEEIDDPEEFSSRPGFLGWLQSSLRDRTGWRSMAYMGLKVPLATVGILAGFAFWWDAFFCLTFPLWGGSGNSPAVYGLPRIIFGDNFFSGGQTGFLYEVGVFLAGVVFLFAAPWAVRAVLYLDRRVLRVLLAPDPVALRVRSLEQARAQTVDASAATLRRIERDLHDGTQAQLVALAMRLGMAKEKLAEWPTRSLTQTRSASSTRCVSWWTTPTGAQRKRSWSCGIWPAGSIPLHSTSGLKGPCHPGGPQYHPDRPQPVSRVPARAGYRGHRLLLRRRAAGQRGPACLCIERHRYLHRTRTMVARGGARRRHGWGTALTVGVVVQRIGRPHRSRPRCGRASRHRQPAAWPYGGHRGPAATRVDDDTSPRSHR